METKHVYYLCDLTTADSQQINLALSLQGLLNRKSPKLFLRVKPKVDDHWIEWYGKAGYIPEKVSLESLIAQASKVIKGIVIYDPQQPWTIAAACNKAAVSDSLVVTEKLSKQYNLTGLPVNYDFRSFSDELSTYLWSFREVWPYCNHNLLAFHPTDNSKQFQLTQDILIARKGFAASLTINDADYPAEADLAKRILKAADNQASLLGWHGKREVEATYVAAASRHNVLVHCSGVSNLSFHQHIKSAGEFKQERAETPPPKADGKYVTFVLSDGDSFHSMADGQKGYWYHEKRGTFPLGWEVAPLLLDFAPGILDYYYRTKTANDYFLCGPSGAGYNYLSEYPEKKEFLSLTRKLMQQLDLDLIYTINRKVKHLPGRKVEHDLGYTKKVYSFEETMEFNGIKDLYGADLVAKDVVEAYSEHIPEAIGFFQGWEVIPEATVQTYNNKPWFPTKVLASSKEQTLKDIINLVSKGENFIPVHINCYSMSMDELAEAVSELEKQGCQIVAPNVFVEYYQKLVL